MAQVSTIAAHLARDDFWTWLRNPFVRFQLAHMMDSKCWMALPVRVMVLGKHESP